ncbi:MAG: FAD-dependent oxidoreductase [Pseudomonadota bacterium]
MPVSDVAIDGLEKLADTNNVAGGGADTTAADAERREVVECDLCIIGAGSGGLSVAAAASAFGRSVVLVEKGKMGGDCLNYGCVPSKALIAAAKRAHMIATSGAFGIKADAPTIDYAAVNKHVHEVIAAIEPNDSVERFTGLGVKVIQAAGRFIDKDTLVAGEYRIKASRFVIATGSSPFIPPIEGLDQTPYFTNETLFENNQKLDHLIIVGGGPIGLEMAQAHRRLGSEVTVLEGAKALAKDDPEMTHIVLKKLRDEGIDIREGTTVKSVERTSFGTVKVGVEADGASFHIEGSHLLLAVGRQPTVSHLGLDEAGIKYTPRGIKVDKGLTTTNKSVFAIGDVTGGLQFTHVANYHAGLVIRKALFRVPVSVDNTIIPWVTFTDPELAHVGLTEDQAATKYGSVKVLRWPYQENDRAQAERTTTGHVKVVLTKRGRIIGATIVGPQAGEIISMWSLAVSQKMNIKAMTAWVSPYPTLSEINKRAAYKFYATFPSTPVVRKIIGWLEKLG